MSAFARKWSERAMDACPPSEYTGPTGGAQPASPWALARWWWK